MRVFALVLLAGLLAAAYAIAPLQHAAERIPDEYVIMIDRKLDAGRFATSLQTALSSRRFRLGRVLNTFKKLNTLYLQLSEDAVEFVRRFDGVIHVEENGVFRTQAIIGNDVASWGLDRIDQRDLPLDDTYAPPNSGSNINAYVIDTGIWPTHNDFGDRAEVAYDAVIRGDYGIDCNGHGTHCAGTVGGTDYGVAKNVKLFGVRVFGCVGAGTTGNILEGMNWVAENGVTPGVVSMSLGGGASDATDAAVDTLNERFVVVVAAGNSNANACNYSPARSDSALTVGATDNTDTRASFSNYGQCVDMFAPGVNIKSAWTDSDTATKTISGTSMACPHVSGVAALYLYENQSLSPRLIREKILNDATPNKVSDERLSPNLLLYAGAN